ncbi:MAG: hypothetical protein AAFP86_12635, partial [Planctomycetota bacterium]
MNRAALEALIARASEEGGIASLDASREDVLASRIRVAGAKTPLVTRAETRAQANEIGGSLGEREVRYVMSTPNPAGIWGDVIPARAWDLSRFKKSGQPLLWSHDGRSRPPIGKMRSVRKVDHEGRKVLAGIAGFLDEGQDPQVDALWQLVADGFLNCGSVGFEITDAHKPSEKEVEQYGLDVEGEHRFALVVDTARLVEFSVCSVGADEDAVTLRDENEDGLMLYDALGQLVDAGICSQEQAAELRGLSMGITVSTRAGGSDAPEEPEPAQEPAPEARAEDAEAANADDADNFLEQLDQLDGERAADGGPDDADPDT